MKIRRVFSIVAFLLAVFAAASVRAVDRQVLRHRLAAFTSTLQFVDRLPATNQFRAVLCLPLRNQLALTNLLRQIYAPTSPSYRQYLTTEEFTERFGPTKEDYAAVIAFAQAQGLVVTATHPNRVLVDVGGSVADFERVFHMNLRFYRHPREDRTFYAPDTAPSVDLAVPLHAVCGFDNYALPRPAGLRPVPATSIASVAPLSGSGPSGNLMGSDFRAAYAPGVTLTGAGQSVGLLQFDGYYASDIATYVGQTGLTGVPLQNVLLDGFSGRPGINNSEVAMDIEMAISMAPGLDRIIVYEAGASGLAIDILNRMATDNLAKQLSASWTWGTLDPGTEQVFQQFAAQGQSYFNAAGDNDAYTGFVDAPTDDPYITIVGGTTLTTGPGGVWASEKVWNWGGGTGSGGGISTTYAIPAWQQGVDMSANHGSTTMRNIPDVAMAADNIWVIYGSGKSGAFGGTSAASPLWAAFTALVNQQAVARGLSTAGFLNPAIYALGAGSVYSAAFHDIATGDNTRTGSPSNFHAVSGYDLCTGWGTPAGQALIEALAGPPEPLGVTPADGVTASGPVGGPFSVNAQTYVLTNAGATALSWSCATTASWLDVSPGSGTLPPGSIVDVTVSLNAAANNLLTGVYLAAAHFTDANTASVQSRAFSLQVGQSLVQNGGFETGDFTGWSQSGNTAYITVSANPSYVHSGTYGAQLGPNGSLGYLSQTLDTVPGQNYQVSCWLNSPNGSAPNEFQVSWNGKPLFDQVNIGAIGWTNVHFVVIATGTTSVLQFGLRDDPSFLSLDDVGVTPFAVTNVPGVLALTVQSANGGAVPGSVTAVAGTTLGEQIVNSPVVNGTTQYVCCNATVKSNTFTQISPTNVTLTLTNNATLTWLWTTNYWLHIATNGNGSVDVSDGWRPKGSNAQVTATAGDHALFTGWSGQTSGCTITSNVITAPMTSPRSITVNFVRTVIVTATVDPLAGGTVTGGGMFVAGSNTVALVATTNAGWRFDRWSDGSTVAAHATLKNVNTDTNFAAHFIQRGTVTAKADPAAGGTVTGGGTYDIGTITTLVAKANASWRFKRWEEDGDTNATRQITVTGNITNTALFVRTVTLTVVPSPANGGKVTGGGTYETQTPATLTATPSNNWRFVRWSNGSTDVTNSVWVTNTATYTATFIQRGTLVVQAAPPDGGSATGGGVYDVGSNVTLRATPSNSWRFAKWNNGITNRSRTVTITAGVKTNTAIFLQQTRIVAVADPADGGTVVGGGTYDTNALVTLTATVRPNWKFQRWADTNLVVLSRTLRAPVGGATYTGLFAMITGEISMSTNRLEFGAVPVGQSATQTVAVTNLGPNAVNVTSVTVPAGYTATPTAFTLASNGMAKVMIVFKPTTVGVKTGTVSLVSNAARGVASVAVNGTGLAATRVIRLLGDLNFGTVRIGTTSNRTLAVSNDGNSAMIVTALAFSGTGSTAFRLPDMKIPFTVASGATTNLTVTFTPTVAATNRATLTATVISLTAGTNMLAATGTGTTVIVAVTVVKATASGASAGKEAASGALVMRVIDLTLPPQVTVNGEWATVVMAGGKARVLPTVLAAAGETTFAVALECYGTDTDNDGIPDAVAAALGDRLKEGVKLLTIQYANGRIMATTPFEDILIVEGIPMPLDALPATWRLVPDGKVR